MLTVLTLLKLKPSPNGERHGERAMWREHGRRYLETWMESVDRYVPGPKQIVVMTDSTIYAPLPPNTAAMHSAPLDRDVDAPGFWAKLNMFRAEMSAGKCLYMDLDNTINGPLDELCALTPDPLIMLDDRRVPGLPNGSMVLFDAERCRGIWSSYVANQRAHEQYYVAHGDDFTLAYDQAFIATSPCVEYPPPLFQSLLPPNYILNARSELPNVTDWSDTRVVFGGGAEGKPHLSNHPAFSLSGVDEQC